MATPKQKTYIYNLLRSTLDPEIKEIFDNIKGDNINPCAIRATSGYWMSEREYNLYQILDELPQKFISLMISIITGKQTRNYSDIKKLLNNN